MMNTSSDFSDQDNMGKQARPEASDEMIDDLLANLVQRVEQRIAAESITSDYAAEIFVLSQAKDGKIQLGQIEADFIPEAPDSNHRQAILHTLGLSFQEITGTVPLVIAVISPIWISKPGKKLIRPIDDPSREEAIAVSATGSNNRTVTAILHITRAANGQIRITSIDVTNLAAQRAMPGEGVKYLDNLGGAFMRASNQLQCAMEGFTLRFSIPNPAR